MLRKKILNSRYDFFPTEHCSWKLLAISFFKRCSNKCVNNKKSNPWNHVDSVLQLTSSEVGFDLFFLFAWCLIAEYIWSNRLCFTTTSVYSGLGTGFFPNTSSGFIDTEDSACKDVPVELISELLMSYLFFPSAIFPWMVVDYEEYPPPYIIQIKVLCK